MHNLWKMMIIAFLSISMICGKHVHKLKQRVCVIGAGIAGLTSARYLAEHPKEFELVVFEKNSDVGGLWIYTNSTTVDKHGLPVHSSMYKNARTNSPKNIDSFPDFPEFGGDNTSFPTHWDFQRYQKNVSDRFKLWQYIKFDTNVEKVLPLHNLRWRIEAKNLNTEERFSTDCDGVMVANGHETKPRIPHIPGIESFSGQVMHSHLYRIPEVFAHKTVVLLGIGVSAVELALDISPFAKKIYLSHRRHKLSIKLPKNVHQIAGVTGAKSDELILNDGRSIKTDVLIYCTGYKVDFPFLDASSGFTVEGDGKYVHYLYERLINIERPTMALLNTIKLGFKHLIPRAQAQYFVAILRGKVNLPSREEMLKEAQWSLRHTPTSLDETNIPYYKHLAETAGFETLPSYVEPVSNVVFNLFFSDPMRYRNRYLVVYNNGSFNCVDI